jgi:flavoprotein
VKKLSEEKTKKSKIAWGITGGGKIAEIVKTMIEIKK